MKKSEWADVARIRAALEELKASPELKAITDRVEELKGELDELHVAVADSVEGRSDRWKESEAGEIAAAEVTGLEEAANALAELNDELQGTLDKFAATINQLTTLENDAQT